MIVILDRHNGGRNRRAPESTVVPRENVMLALAPPPRLVSEMEWPSWLTMFGESSPSTLRTNAHRSRRKWGNMEPLAPL